METGKKETIYQKTKQELLNQIRDRRLQKGWSIYRMARETGIDRTYLLRIERGEVAIGLNNLVYICNALDLDIILNPKQK